MNRESTYWTTLKGKRISVKDLDDTHLANIIHHMNTFMKGSINIKFYALLLTEVIFRGLSKDFLGRAPYAFKDEDGQWKMFDKQKLEYRTVGK